MDDMDMSGKIEPERARPAATLILVREREGAPPELLMIERSSKMRFAGGAAVFPGGGIDADDIEHAARLAAESGLSLEPADAAARVGAIRETLEETGLAFAIAGISSGAQVKDVRARLHDGTRFSDLCAEYGWRPVLESLVPWSRWCPPSSIQPMYDTRFYLGDANRLAANGWADATESVGLFWQDADTVIRRAEDGELSIIYPTRRNLERLAQYRGFDALRAHAEEYPSRLVETYVEERAEGRFLCIPEGHGYPVLEENIDTARRR